MDGELMTAAPETTMAEELRALVAAGRPEAVVDRFVALPESERRRRAQEAVRIVAEVCGVLMDEISEGPFARKRGPAYTRVQQCARLALYGSAGLAQIKKAGWRAMPQVDDDLLSVMEARRPAWLSDWAAWLIEQNPVHFNVLRPLIRAGLAAAPESDAYVLGILSITHRRHPDTPTIKQALLADPAVLEDPFWRLFSVPGFTEHSPAAYERFVPEGGETWCGVVCELAAEGRLSRARLLDESLAALTRDFNSFQARWFAGLHEALTPSPAERQARLEGYLALLRSPVASTVSYGLKTLEGVRKAGALPGSAFLAAAEPAVVHPRKGHAAAALKLLGRLLKDGPACAGAVAGLAALALEHPEADVQQAALILLEKAGDTADPNLRAAVEARAAGVSPIHGERLQAWLGSAAPAAALEAESEGSGAALAARLATLPVDLLERVGIPALRPAPGTTPEPVRRMETDPCTLPRLDPAGRIAPIESLEELLDVALAALEESDDVPRLDRLFDGVLRLQALRGDDFARITAPLRKRLAQKRDQLLKNYYPQTHLLSIIWVLSAWLEDAGPFVERDRKGHPFFHRDVLIWNKKGTEVPARVPYYLDHQGARAAYLLRAGEIAVEIRAGRARPLLSAATHQGAWIAAADLVESSEAWAAAGGPAVPADQLMALLRLAPDGRTAALAQATAIPGEFGAALRHALGGGEAIGETPGLWLAASRARCGIAADPALDRAFPDLDGGRPGRYGYRVDAEPGGSYEGAPAVDYVFKLTCENIWPEPAIAKRRFRGYATDTTKPASGLAMLPTLQGRRKGPERWHSVPELGLLQPGAELLWPACKEAIFAHSARDCGVYIHDPREVGDPVPPGTRLLLDPDEPITPVAALLVALSLGSGTKSERDLATDVAIAAIADGRLDGPLLGAPMAGLLFSGLILPKRWQQSLGEVARLGPLHRQVVGEALELALAGERRTASQNIGALLELLHETCRATGEAITDPAARAYLETFAGSSKSAKSAKALLNLPQANPAASRRAAQAEALAARLDRAETWVRRDGGDP